MKNTVLALRGHLGVGKSTLAQELSERYGFVKLSKDDFFLAAIDELSENPHAASRIAYASIRNILFTNRHSPLNFVVDAPFRNVNDVDQLGRLTRKWGYRFGSVLLTCSDRDVWDKRLQQRSLTPNPIHQITSLEALDASEGGLVTIEYITGELVLDTASEDNELEALAMQCFRHADQLA